ncbi:1,4-dihydroxy-2-naphthoate octaprenyltransferase [bacterium]|nr:1,4-dihydroxy-2-naphthoate octaprenyltransferase [bacterium]
MTSFQYWLKELRSEFLTGSITPVLLSTALVWYETETWNPLLFTLTLLGVIFLHLGANTANDYFDHLSGNDIVNTEYVRPFTGGSRLIQRKLIPPGTVLATSLLFLAAALIVGIFLVASAGAPILLFGIIGIISGYFYTAPPFKFSHRGFGEFVVGLGFGLIGIGTYFVQAGTVSVPCVLVSLPLAFLITSIIVINEFQDSKADSSTGKKTVVVRLGKKRAVYLFAALTTASYIPIIIGTVGGILPPLTLTSLVTLPIGLKAILIARKFYDEPRNLTPANGLAILNHILTGIILTIAYFIAA